MSEFTDSVAKVFEPDGALCRRIEGFRRRESQAEFSLAVARALEERSSVVVEAGTGTGKTFAYLVPAILSGSKTIVSTASKTLQDQLYNKDVSRLCSALAASADVAVLKGRNNYICKQRLESFVAQGLMPERDSYSRLKKIMDYARISPVGDKNEVPGVPENDLLWPWVTSTKENCLGSKCPHFEDCFLTQARRRAQQANIVIVNHHLFLADLSLKDDTMGSILPEADLVIFDEAHKLHDIGIDYFSEILSLREVNNFIEDGRVVGKAHAPSVRWDDEFLALRNALLKLHQTLHHRLDIDFETEVEIASIEGFSEAVAEPMKGLTEALKHVAGIFLKLKDAHEELAQAADRADELLTRLNEWKAVFASPETVKTVGGTPSVLWMKLTEQNAIFSNTPLSLAESFAKSRARTKNAWVYTSATISTRRADGSADFSYFLGELGLAKDTPTYSWESPFDYPYQARFYLPAGLPGVFEPNYSEALVQATWPLIEKTRGHAFFLCTSFRSMESIAEALRSRAGANFTLCVQGESPKSELLERFMAADNAILVGSMSFWEGVDMKGELLQLVVIDKMPFAQFDTPVARARKAWLTEQGRNAFVSYQLPEMITTLRQGVGRLIRSENDFGVVVFGDSRLIEKRYGALVLNSLPPMIRTRDFARVYSFLDNPDEAY